jgi:glyoxylase-like metal-dependent hydrolase (beta-lactamase superfamily II)
MTVIHHLNCGVLKSPFIGNAICHCLLLEDKNGLALIDTGFGLREVRDPEQYISRELIDFFAISFAEKYTAFRQIEKMGLNTADVNHCIISHLDFDHIGGLADFPDATVHLSVEEYDSFKNNNTRYLQAQLDYQPLFRPYGWTYFIWHDFPARKLEIGFECDVYLIQLFGHTSGHCGAVIEQAGKTILYAGDAFFTKAELTELDHPATEAAAGGAEDNELRVASFKKLRKLFQEFPEIEIVCYHDPEALIQKTI